ncbi:reverse transcriptase [Gossypium australe]|uniref:Reverse transcriptase n=1 Tax=Gossypium australe TaxID=47621 RepID=A0A5B6X4W1_9ROSI|nr:reverse transcriptase [Gossypium australe]
MLGNLSINAISKEEIGENQSGIRPYIHGSVLNNWIAEEILVIFKTNSEYPDINNMSDAATNSESPFDTDIVVHQLPIREECKPVQQKLQRMRPDVLLKIKEDVKKQFDSGLLQVVKYSEWVANIVSVPKKDEKVRMCVDYRDLNKVSSKDNFPLPHIDTLVDNMAGYSLFSFMDGFSRYNQIKMHPEDMEKTTFLKLNLAKCTFRARSRKLLGFVVIEKGIGIDPDKVKAIQELPSLSTQKEVWGFLGRLNYIARVKHYLSNAPVLMPPNLDKPLILYLAVFGNFMGCVLGQHDELGRKERAIYYLNENQMADALTTLASRVKMNKQEDVKPIHMGIYEVPTHCSNIEEEEKDDHPWTSTGETPFSLVYGMETVSPIEVEILSLQVLSELKLDEAE